MIYCLIEYVVEVCIDILDVMEILMDEREDVEDKRDVVKHAVDRRICQILIASTRFLPEAFRINISRVRPIMRNNVESVEAWHVWKIIIVMLITIK